MNRRKRFIFAALVLAVAVYGCREPEKAPFTIGSSFTYAAAYTTPDGRKTKHDTLTYTIQPRDVTSHTPGLKKIRWGNTRNDYYQVRSLNTEDNIVELQLPVNYAGFENEKIAIAGHPTVELNSGAGHITETAGAYLKGYSTLAGLTIKQHSAYLRDTSIEFDGVLLRCRLIERYNTTHLNKLGRYYLVFTYNPIYGFITMDYTYPNGRHISFRLTDVAISGR